MKNITVTLYSFNELEKQAKEKALTAYCNLNFGFDWWDIEYDDFVTLCSYLGVTVDKETIRFSGFYSQGDGSAFSASVNIQKLVQAIQTESWKAYAPTQEFGFTHPVVDRRVLALAASGILPQEPQITSRTRGYGVNVDLGISVILEGSRPKENVFDELEKLQDWLNLIAVKLNFYLYSLLERQYEYLTGETAIGESIAANDYLFTADGRSADYLTELTQ